MDERFFKVACIMKYLVDCTTCIPPGAMVSSVGDEMFKFVALSMHVVNFYSIMSFNLYFL